MSSEDKKSIFIETLGCPKNQVDSDILAQSLVGSGWHIVDRAADANIVIVNTCGFIEDAKAESIESIWEYIRAKQCGQIDSVVVTGCLAERYPSVLEQEMPEIDLVFGNRNPKLIAEAILGGTAQKPRLSVPSNFLVDWYEHPLGTNGHYWAYLKVTEGCNNRCSYCAIPSIRGGLRSAPIESLIAQARFYIESGIKEIILVGQDTSAYGLDTGRSRFPELLRRVSEIEGDFWIRILYTHPRNMTDEAIAAIVETPKVLPYIDMPIQHISDRLLARMERHVNSEQIREIVRKLKSGKPDIVLRTSVIVGFPGETQEDFEQLSAYLDEGHFIHGGVFAYSPEDGTPAVSFKDELERDTIAERKMFIEMIFDRIRQETNSALQNRVLEVLVEKEGSRSGVMWGRTRYDAPEIDRTVRFRGSAKIGSFAQVMIIKGSGFHLLGVQK